MDSFRTTLRYPEAMEHLLLKIRELEKEADKLVKKKHVGDQEKFRIPEEALSFGQWTANLRAKAGGWTGGPLVVLSLFDGIGGIWAALSLLGIPFIGYSCELNHTASQVVKARYPMVRHVGDITALEVSSIPQKVDLVVGGFPCQDLTWLGHKQGLHGQRSKLFFEMLRIIKVFNPKWFLAENVASMAWQDRDEISKHLRAIPIEIDSQELTPSRRRRLYWSNIPYPQRLPQLRDHRSTSLQSVLDNGTALNSKIGCILSTNRVRDHKVSLDLVMDNMTCSLRYLSITEVERAMGFPAGYTNVNFRSSEQKVFTAADDEFEENRRITRQCNAPSTTPPKVHVLSRRRTAGENQKLRWRLLGNSFSVNVIAYLLSPILERVGREEVKPIILPDSVREQDCSAMDAGEVWALYNSHERPNWYAVIESRTGDRFSPTELKGKKTPVHIEVRFMEMTDAYAAQEVDEWDAIRGTGLFRVRTVIDNQSSWVAFSHRIASYWKFDGLLFIFPAKDEVWAVQDRVADSKYLVYVVESYVDKNKAREGKPGKECFHGRCRLMQLVETELYRLLDKEIVYTELSLFSFQAPYIYRNEGTLLKIDLTNRQRAAGTDHVKRKRKRHRRGSDSDTISESDPDSEGDEELLEEDTALADIMGGDGLARHRNWQDCNDSPATGSSYGVCDT